MGSTFMGLEIAKRGLSTHQQALQTTGHNISNADNKNYARQRVRMESMSPLYEPALNRSAQSGMIGQGVQVSEVQRIRDHFIDDRIYNTEQSKMYWETRQRYLHHMEVVYNEPSDESMRTQLDKFWQSWQELSQFPEEMSHREVVRTNGRELTFRIRETFERLSQLRTQADNEVEVAVNELNSLASQVRELNEKILKSEALGDNPNDLLDSRDAIIQKMSSIADINVERQDPDELIVYLGGQMLVQGEAQNFIKLNPDASNEGLTRLHWESNNEEVILKNGKLHSLLELRDIEIKDHIERMDLFAVNLADIVNEVHRGGFGLNKETNVNFLHLENLSRNIEGNYDLNRDGVDEVTSVFKVAGKNKILEDRPLGISGTLTFARNDEDSTPIYINYRADQTLEQVVKEINRSDSGVVSYINQDNFLVIKAKRSGDDWQSNFMIRHMEDSGELLVGFAGILQSSGPGGAFDYSRINETRKLAGDTDSMTLTPALHPAGSIRLSDEVDSNISFIAATGGFDSTGFGKRDIANGAKDGSNALRIAQALRHKPNMFGKHKTSDDFYNSLISRLAVESRTAEDQMNNQETIMKNFENMRQSIMGVNLDEEMANMVQFQHGYNAAARVIQTMNEMLDQIINRLG